jgi:glycosyltransferase involved in cell wall biosynthesis
MSKICIIGPSKKFYSGLSACTISLANALSRDNDVSVILLRNLLPKFLYPGKAHVDRRDYLLDFVPGVKVYDGMDWNSPVSWFKALKFLLKERPDGVIALWWTSSVAHMQLFLMLMGKMRLKTRWILEMHEIVDALEQEIFLIRLYSKIIGRLEIRLADELVVHSAAVKEQLLGMYRLDRNRVSVIPVGLFDQYHRDFDQLSVKQELGIAGDFVILNFGSIRKYKGVPFLVEAFNRLPASMRDRSRLVIAGENWGDDDLVPAAIEASAAKDRISYRPQFVPDEMIPKYFTAADVVVLPYLRTCGSAVVNIAMACGKPVITTDLSTLRESTAGYEGASFVPPADSNAIAGKLSELFSLKDAGKSLSYGIPGHTWDYVASKFAGLVDMS